MRYSTIWFLLIVNLFMVGCSTNSGEGGSTLFSSGNSSFSGSWILKQKYVETFADSNKIATGEFPVVYDFQNNERLLIKRFGSKDVEQPWSYAKDELLIDSVPYKVLELAQENFVIEEKKEGGIRYVFEKPIDVSIDMSRNEIRKIFIDNIWATSESKITEYFEDSLMVIRIPAKGDSLDDFALEYWDVGEHNGLFFYYNIVDWKRGVGGYHKMQQIKGVSEQRIIFDDNGTEVAYTKVEYNDSLKLKLEEMMDGLFISGNKMDAFHGPFHEVPIQSGVYIYLVGDLKYEFKGGNWLNMNIEEYKQLWRRWSLSKDGSILLFKHIDRGIRRTDIALINSLDENGFTLQLKNNLYPTLQVKPTKLVLNVIQKFEKVEQ
ncbi:MAG: hypothetical protein IH946_01525 [Bacteroidetes bacterium]|nr:hypothetical protein [Bacteroidota bacterium]